MFRLAIPGVIGALLFSGLGLVEAGFLKSAGTDALASVAVVFPLIILAGMFSAGAMGGAISGFTARAIGAGDREQAEAVLVCAVVISLAGGVLMWLLVVQFGPVLYHYASDSAIVVNAATRYAALVFPAIPAFWLVNMLCSFMRGTGDMITPAVVAGAMLLIYAMLGAIMIPQAGEALEESIRMAALAMDGAYMLALVIAIYCITRKSQPVRFRLSAFRMSTLLPILKQGLLASSQSVMTVTYTLVTTLLFSRFGTEWLAGFGVAVRLELLMVPVIFGVGASLIAIVGAYVGAGQREKAIAIAWRGVFINAAIIGCIGLLLSAFPYVWCGLVGSDATVIEHCNLSVRIISPTYLFFALGLGCYFASQGLGTLKYPVLGALLRLVIVSTGILWVSGQSSATAVLLLVAFAATAYGVFITCSLWMGPWCGSK